MNHLRKIAMLCVVSLAMQAGYAAAAQPEGPPAKPKEEKGFLEGAYEPPKAPEAPSIASLMARLVLPMVAVVGSIYLIAWFYKKKGGIGALGGRKGKFSEVVEVTPLGGQRFVYLVRVVDRLMVLGVTNDGVSALGEIAEEELTASVQGGMGQDFAQMLEGMSNPKPSNGPTQPAARQGWGR